MTKYTIKSRLVFLFALSFVIIHSAQIVWANSVRCSHEIKTPSAKRVVKQDFETAYRMIALLNNSKLLNDLKRGGESEIGSLIELTARGTWPYTKTFIINWPIDSVSGLEVHQELIKHDAQTEQQLSSNQNYEYTYKPRVVRRSDQPDRIHNVSVLKRVLKSEVVRAAVTKAAARNKIENDIKFLDVLLTDELGGTTVIINRDREGGHTGALVYAVATDDLEKVKANVLADNSSRKNNFSFTLDSEAKLIVVYDNGKNRSRRP